MSKEVGWGSWYAILRNLARLKILGAKALVSNKVMLKLQKNLVSLMWVKIPLKSPWSDLLVIFQWH